MNNNDDTFIGFVGGLFLGAGICILITALPSSYSAQGAAAIEACEATLPRNETCVITAQPALAADKEN